MTNTQLPSLVDQFGNTVRADPTSLAPQNYKELAAIISHEEGRYGNTAASRPYTQSVWVYSCVTMIAQAFAQIPMWLGRRSPTTEGRKRGFRQITEHPLLDLLEQPNPLMTRSVFFETWITYLLTGGNVWIYIDEPTSVKLPRSLLVFGVNSVRPKKDPVSGRLMSWLLRIRPGVDQEIPLEDMIHTKLPTPYDPIMGLPPVAAMQAQLDADYARTIFDRAFFRNNASPDAVLVYKHGTLSPDQREQIRESWNEFHGGVDKAGGLAVIGGDFDFKVWGVSHSQSQFIENRSFTREEVGTAFKVPVLLLNATRGGALTREALDSAQMAFYDHAVFPNRQRFAEGFNSRIVRSYDRGLLLDFDIDTLPVMTAYLKSKSEVFDKLVKNGTPPNVAKNMLDMNMDDIEGGDVGYLPGNYVPIPALSKVKTMQPPQATPNTPPGQRPPSPKSAPTRIDDILTVRLQEKIKGLLFNLRAEALKGNEGGPFNLTSARRAWVRRTLPLVAVAAQDEVDAILGRRSVGERLLALPDGDRSEALTEMQRFVEKITFNNPALSDEIESIVARSTELLDEAWAMIQEGAETREVFGQLKGKARMFASDTIRWARHAARYVTTGRAEATCEHYEGRYPGDARISLVELLNCDCA